MSTFKLFFTGDDGDTCMAEEIAELHVPECMEPATWFAEDRATEEQTPLCAEHKDALKAAGLSA